MNTGTRNLKARWTGSIVVTAMVVALAGLSIVSGARSEEEETAAKTALLIIDVQQFYFPGGLMPLEKPEAAARNCKRLLEKFRGDNGLIVHVGHNSNKEFAFHPDVEPLEGEKVFYKDEVNAFNGTGLLAYLREAGVGRLVVCGMQTHMCVEAAVRAAHDFGFECVLVGDACATRDLKFGGETVAANDVHNSTLSTVDRTYGTVVDTQTYLENY